MELKYYKFQCQNDSETSNCVKMTVNKIGDRGSNYWFKLVCFRTTFNFS